MSFHVITRKPHTHTQTVCIPPQASGSPEYSRWTSRPQGLRKEHGSWKTRLRGGGGWKVGLRGPSRHSGFPGSQAHLPQRGQKPYASQLQPATRCHMPGSWLLARVTAVPQLRGQAVACLFREGVVICRSYCPRLSPGLSWVCWQVVQSSSLSSPDCGGTGSLNQKWGHIC